ncbi:unnamed protein product [marine sediment metagenome]|uniref:Uncharacterized protein n=1 Tax=marine sediment metagenome TaxID=412755 RepID=X0Z3L9_9ZZZZ
MVQCPVCKRKFHKGKTNEFGRMSKHLWKEHPDYMKKKIRKGVRDKGKQLDEELQYTDDMILQSLMSAGIPLQAPQQIPYANQPVVHQDIAGAILTGIKIGQAIATGVKAGKTIKKAVTKKKGKGR